MKSYFGLVNVVVAIAVDVLQQQPFLHQEVTLLSSN